MAAQVRYPLGRQGSHAPLIDDARGLSHPGGGDTRHLQDSYPGRGVEHHQVGLTSVPGVIETLESRLLKLLPQSPALALAGPLQPHRHLVGQELAQALGHGLQTSRHIVAARYVRRLQEGH